MAKRIECEKECVVADAQQIATGPGFFCKRKSERIVNAKLELAVS